MYVSLDSEKYKCLFYTNYIWFNLKANNCVVQFSFDGWMIKLFKEMFL